jgi:hypothetical protein
MKNKVVIFALGLIMSLASCTDADVASQNISEDAEMFKVYRRVVFYNGITDKYILQIEGYCSVDVEDGRLAVIIKTQKGDFLKHYLGLSDNVTYFSEQLEPSKVSTKNYKVIFKPSIIIPDVDLK